MLSLIKKELQVQLSSPIMAVAAALFLFLTGFAFTAQVTQATPHRLPEASLRGMTYFMAVILLFLAPFFTMKLFAEERKTGTLELLKTSPLSDLEIVLGKFLAAWLLVGLLLLLTLEFPIFLWLSGAPDLWPMLLSYLGLFLMGGSLLAAGLFCSALTANQMIAAIASFVFLLTLWFLAEVGGVWGEEISIARHLDSFSLGILDLGDILYYLFFTFLLLFLTVRSLEAERWK